LQRLYLSTKALLLVSNDYFIIFSFNPGSDVTTAIYEVQSLSSHASNITSLSAVCKCPSAKSCIKEKKGASYRAKCKTHKLEQEAAELSGQSLSHLYRAHHLVQATLLTSTIEWALSKL
jgi:hypothetical protein